MKELSSRWAVAALIAPVLVTIAILAIGIDRPQAATGGKGSVQLSLTGSIKPLSGLAVQSLLLNVISVRLNPSSDPNVSELDPNWQTIAAPPGAAAGAASTTLSFGGNFGPNGNAVGVGQGRSEIQIDLALLQGDVKLFNTGLVKAQTYRQAELILDPTTPGLVVPQCGTGVSTGEGCIPYPLSPLFGNNLTSIRFQNSGGVITVSRNTTSILVLDIDAALINSPTSSTSAVTFTPSICVASASGQGSPCPPPPLPALGNFAAFITDTVSGATKKTIVDAELSGTSTVVASSQVFKVGNSFEYTMVLPAPSPGASPALYDFFTFTPGHTTDAHARVRVVAGTFNPAPAPDPFHFTIRSKGTRPVSGVVFDACTGGGIPGASVEIFAPASMVDTENCAVSGAAPPCTSTCGILVNNPSGNDISPGCIIIGTTSTSDTGFFPLPGSTTQLSPFQFIPLPPAGAEYALKTTASGFNGELLGLSSNKSQTGFECKGSLFPKNSCNFSLQHGQLGVTADIGTGATKPTAPLDVLVNVEDSGTFNGEAVGMVTIPAGQPSNAVPVAINVPVNAPTSSAGFAIGDESFATADAEAAAAATASATPTPVVIGGASSYDLFASVQDLFGSAPQKVSGHQIAVRSGVLAPAACQQSVAPALIGLACVGHGSVAGTISNPDANTRVLVSKLDPSQVFVDLMSDQVSQVSTGPNFAICAPADSYLVTRTETQLSGTPVPESSTVVTLATPIVLNTPAATATATPVPCLGICSDFPNNSGKGCLLCQQTQPITNLL